MAICLLKFICLLYYALKHAIAILITSTDFVLLLHSGKESVCLTKD